MIMMMFMTTNPDIANIDDYCDNDKDVVITRVVVVVVNAFVD